MKTTYTKEILSNAINQSISFAQALLKLNLSPKGGNYKTIKKYCDIWNISTSHFLGRGHLKGKSVYRKKIPLINILVQNSFYTTHKLKQRLIEENYFKHVCSICNMIEWCDTKIPLELDHINGINTDNRLENLRLICPNCHAQTQNYRGKNKCSRYNELLKQKSDIRKKLDPMPKCLMCENRVKCRRRKCCSYECSRKSKI